MVLVTMWHVCFVGQASLYHKQHKFKDSSSNDKFWLIRIRASFLISIFNITLISQFFSKLVKNSFAWVESTQKISLSIKFRKKGGKEQFDHEVMKWYVYLQTYGAWGVYCTVYINEILIVIWENFSQLKNWKGSKKKSLHLRILKYLESWIKRKFEKYISGFFK